MSTESSANPPRTHIFRPGNVGLQKAIAKLGSKTNVGKFLKIYQSAVANWGNGAPPEDKAIILHLALGIPLEDLVPELCAKAKELKATWRKKKCQ